MSSFRVSVVVLSTTAVASFAVGVFARSIFVKVVRVLRKKATRALDKDQIYELRKRYFSESQSVSYSNGSNKGLLVVRGQGQYLYDECNNQYLDTRNNVGHVGWQHPYVLSAIERQSALTNANSRYLHETRVKLADKLLATFPKELNKVFFVNSGSEANDLALRLAQIKTGTVLGENGDCIVVERAYHGHTDTLVKISPYKFMGKGGLGNCKWVHVTPCPDTYRQAGKPVESFTSKVEEACCAIEKSNRRVTAFICESGMSVAGVIIPPKNYLNQIYKSVKSRGGVCIADEVQVGFGRYGSFFWGFQQQKGAIPDIVTLGKPFGNGFPLAAVVCTSEIASSFANGMEYFNTFGGNPIACAAGLAVLETIENESLQDHALQTGVFLKQKLQKLAESDAGELIGDIRGVGLFVGIEFVRDRVSKTPATQEVSLVVTKLLREYKILTSIDGEYDNVIVMKPPLKFNKDNVTTFVRALRATLKEVSLLDLTDIEMTPT